MNEVERIFLVQICPRVDEGENSRHHIEGMSFYLVETVK
jgi:hypothetical protein